MNDTFYKSGGPVFLMIGGEGPANALWVVVGQWIRYAQHFGALCLMLEHRFYGLSHPTPSVVFFTRAVSMQHLLKICTKVCCIVCSVGAVHVSW